MHGMLRMFWTLIKFYYIWVANHLTFVQGDFLDRHCGICSIHIQKKKNDMLIKYNFEMLVKYSEGIIPLMKLGYNINSLSVSIDAPNV